ncbi:MAG: pantoate--beta-alanine ligase [Gammaproteobacteria bacterium]|nr:pantoate--beta-alanine ligase [Gammaproteobacteria bacterium]MCW8910573.1 pantoate--beta-alanine ligase [Gammaproteobacteria bacterium]MCW9004050.1 pantoate--beta-alanine ligase [Gammaproteobacteria bacterium]MCW9056471.1 pantoate--beta-alanine ligase [Gammaproteobacteria bacterium]
MNVFKDIQSVRDQVASWKQAGLSIAFVPTMGNLHAGHLQLVAQAKQKADRVVVSIFVNPMQFNEVDDFSAYPRTFEGDVELLKEVSADALFAPSNDELYPTEQDLTTKVIVPGLSDVLEGEYRPGHFTGVATVVCKLFNIVQPDISCFGEKDFQQLMLIRRMVAELNSPVQIEAIATQREIDGLAMSSRNNRLDNQQREKAPQVFQVLTEIADLLKTGNKDYLALEQNATATLDSRGFKAEYVAIRRSSDLAMPSIEDRHLVVLVAARLGDIRLIDNISLSLNSD